MADKIDTANLEAEFQALKVKGKLLQRTLADVSSDYGAFMKQYNEANDRIFTKSTKLQDTTRDVNGGAQSKNPIVLMLIDASSHKFCDELLKKRGPGGAEAAILLRNALNDRIAARFPDIARNKYCLVIRIFADLKTLSLNSGANGKIMSLAPFFTEFEKVGAFFDLVVTADDIGVKNKICDNLKLYMGSEQCKHVFLAAAESPRYYQTLQIYRKETSKITLVFGSGLDGGLRKMGLLLVPFPKVFAPPEGFKPQAISGATFVEKSEIKTDDFLKSSVAVVANENLKDVGYTEKALWSPLFSSKLPACYIGGRIPINSAKQRIDIYVREPTARELEVYEARSRVQEHLCVDHFLRNKCENVNCEFYHGTLEPEAHYVLQHITLGTPCSKGSVCRVANCAYGHICQRGECGHAGNRVEGCRLPGSMHGLDTKVSEWVSPDEHIMRPRAPAHDSTTSATGASTGGGVALSIDEDLLG
ncbi:uncharacterized protein J4E84_006392 [Alternaria hordeiaustralica]|uniref:uncharacterized protein n=1 Tax=Alternaria hordeiaustralica TaxID=1187925 RepID=UPI0020C534C7|nr:uncharacterized protein J4E84_006392 [Alternaria hordeiaustralica]KAI4684402.1 hypothetical protein J4E84_006392 [Alternaria hordeiaustralica]